MEIVRPAEDCAGYRIYVKDDVPLNRSDNEEFLQAGIENAVDLKPEDLKKKGKTKKETHVNSVKVHHVEVINMIKILFICHGNICRSPMAEFVFQNMAAKRGLSDRFHADSAATSREEIGNPPHHGTQSVLCRYKIPMYEHHAIQVTHSDYGQYDYLIGMDSYNLSNMRRIFGGDPDGKIHRLLDFSSAPRDISDPWYTGDFEATYADVFEGCEALLDQLTASLR